MSHDDRTPAVDRARSADEGAVDPILGGIRRVIHDHLELTGEIHPHTEIVTDLALDSLQRMTLVVELENHFGVCFEPEDEEGVATVGDLMKLIAARRGAPDA